MNGAPAKFCPESMRVGHRSEYDRDLSRVVGHRIKSNVGSIARWWTNRRQSKFRFSAMISIGIVIPARVAS